MTFVLLLQREAERDVEYMARMMIDYIIKTIDDNCKAKGTQAVENEQTQARDLTPETFREMVQQEKTNMRMLRLIGEEQATTMSEEKFRKQQIKSLANLLIKNSTMIPSFGDIMSHTEINSKIDIC